MRRCTPIPPIWRWSARSAPAATPRATGLPAQEPDELRADIEQNLATLGTDRLAAVNLRIHSGDPSAVGPVDRELFDRQLDAMIAARDEG